MDTASREIIELLIYVLDINGDKSKIIEYAKSIKLGFDRVILINAVTINKNSTDYISDGAITLEAYSKPLFRHKNDKASAVYLADIDLWLNDQFSGVLFKENKLCTDCYFFYKRVNSGIWKLITEFLPYPDRYLEIPERIIHSLPTTETTTTTTTTTKKKKNNSHLISTSKRLIDSTKQQPLFKIEYI